jgi:hypothetical protein
MYAVKKYSGRLKSDMVRSVRLLPLIFVVSDSCYHIHLTLSKFFWQMREVQNLQSMRHEHVVAVHDWCGFCIFAFSSGVL